MLEVAPSVPLQSSTSTNADIPKLRFIDLFAGLGGFHVALSKLENVITDCVFASELNLVLRGLYQDNYGIECHGDIRKVIKENIDSIPDHDILCAGFPCQPFSKAGKQEGRNDTDRGTLFDEIATILEAKRPKYFILENVQFIRQHDNEMTWNYMEKVLRDLNYDVDHHVYSPHDFGIPQHRQRIFIVGKQGKNSLKGFKWVTKHPSEKYHVKDFIEKNPKDFKPIGDDEKECLDIWQEFISSVPKNIKIPGFPIWSMEFGATYPFEGQFPFQLTADELGQYKGNFGRSLAGLNYQEQLDNLPSYARVTKKFPSWKMNYIRYNRRFYQDHFDELQSVVKKLSNFKFQSWQKLEWNVGDDKRNIRDYLLQFRASGIRVKKNNFFPSLVCTNTQIPIIGWQERYITREEGAKLQSMSGIKLPTNNTACFRALGNAVNARIVQLVAETLIEEITIKTTNELLLETFKPSQYNLFEL